VAQSYAAQPAETRYGPRPVAPSTANLRLAAISSFYTYALRQDLLRGVNPVARVERRRIEAYAAAHPLAYDDLRMQLADLDLTTDAGLRDYALLLIALSTGRRVAELAGMRQEHLTIRKRTVVIDWPRCKGGKRMRDELPRGGARGAAADALVAWIERLAEAERDMRAESTNQHETAVLVVSAPSSGQSGRSPERPVWVSLARNGTAGHPLSVRAIAQLCEKRLGTSKVHALRHTFARALEDAGAKVSEIQAALGHADLGTTGRYLARLHQGENHHVGRLSALYGLEELDQRRGANTRNSGVPESLSSEATEEKETPK
jgi:integrase